MVAMWVMQFPSTAIPVDAFIGKFYTGNIYMRDLWFNQYLLIFSPIVHVIQKKDVFNHYSIVFQIADQIAS